MDPIVDCLQTALRSELIKMHKIFYLFFVAQAESCYLLFDKMSLQTLETDPRRAIL